MELEQNPARRLIELLEAFYKESQNQDGRNTLQVWSVVLNCENKDLLSRMVQLEQLIQDVKDKVLRDTRVKLKDRNLQWVAPVTASLSIASLPQAAFSVRSHYDPSSVGMNMLYVCAQFLSEYRPEIEFSVEDLNAVSSEINLLMAAIEEQVTDADTKYFLLDLLSCCSFGLQNYRIRGPAGLDESLNVTIAKLLRARPSIDQKFESSQNQSEQGIFKRVGEFVKGLVTKAEQLKKIKDGYDALGGTETIKNLLSYSPSSLV